jgi:hypothetical protein
MAKIDLKYTYRSGPISPTSQKVTGFRWDFAGGMKHFYDTKLPFGSKEAPGIFHRLSQTVCRMMARRGFQIVLIWMILSSANHQKLGALEP